MTGRYARNQGNEYGKLRPDYQLALFQNTPQLAAGLFNGGDRRLYSIPGSGLCQFDAVRYGSSATEMLCGRGWHNGWWVNETAAMKYMKITCAEYGSSIKGSVYEDYIFQACERMPPGFRALSEDMEVNFSLDEHQSRHDGIIGHIEVVGEGVDRIMLKIRLGNSRGTRLNYAIASLIYSLMLASCGRNQHTRKRLGNVEN